MDLLSAYTYRMYFEESRQRLLTIYIMHITYLFSLGIFQGFDSLSYQPTFRLDTGYKYSQVEQNNIFYIHLFYRKINTILLPSLLRVCVGVTLSVNKGFLCFCICLAFGRNMIDRTIFYACVACGVGSSAMRKKWINNACILFWNITTSSLLFKIKGNSDFFS